MGDGTTRNSTRLTFEQEIFCRARSAAAVLLTDLDKIRFSTDRKWVIENALIKFYIDIANLQKEF